MPGWTFERDSLPEYRLYFPMPPLFADDAYISDWARESVYFMAWAGIIQGIGYNLFAPNPGVAVGDAFNVTEELTIATREQALVIAVRMIDNR